MGLARVAALAVATLATACTSPSPRPTAQLADANLTTARGTGTVTLTVIGTNDLHGALLPRNGKGGLALLAGYLANVRAARAADGGAVLLVDGGDMFQGTLESNLGEGAAVVRAYGALGYDAVTIGNHEFDFGPVGAAATATAAGDDPFGALKARAAEAPFPFLAANLVDKGSRQPLAWPNVHTSVILVKAGVKVGVLGVTTAETLHVTMAANVRTLAVLPLADAVVAEAARLRAAGAQIVVVAAHAGGKCKQFADPRDASSCARDEEIMRLAHALPAGAVDTIVAGHTHSGVAHLVNGIPIVEAFSGGRAFARVDLTFDRAAGKVTGAAVQPPHDVVAGEYEGKPVVADANLAALLAPAVALAREKKEQALGVVLDAAIERHYDKESAVGNLFTDLMLAARPQAQVAITNGGGLRADLPAGPLTYGALYEAMPFDNRFALVQLTGAQLAALIADNLQADGGILSIALARPGGRITARCDGGTLRVTTPFADEQIVLLATSDFLATGGDLMKLPADKVQLEDGAPIRDEIAAVLAQRGGHLRPADVVDARRPRLEYPGKRPLTCRK